MSTFTNDSTVAGETIRISNEDFFNQQIFVPGLWAVFWLTGVEYLVLWMQKRTLPPPHENILSLLHSSFFVLSKILLYTFEYNAYLWTRKLFGVQQDLFSKSIPSFLTSLLMLDFCFYWFHRASHEIMVLWAIHQVHHSSYDLTIPVSLRHSPLKLFFSWVFFIPLAAIGLPPSHIIFHLELSYVVQTLTHTCAVGNLGPLEWVFNTPSHHRVHHGSRRSCLDKNYGGIFIVWDRIFGTFKREDTVEKPLYGLVFQPPFWNIFHHQVFYMVGAFRKASEMSSWKNYFEALIKGPSWMPGLDWTGRNIDEPNFDDKLTWSRSKANNSLAVNIYVFIHSVIVMILVSYVAETQENGNLADVAGHSIFILSGFLNLSIIYEGKSVTRILELFRCSVGLLLYCNGSLLSTQSNIIAFIYIGSIMVWLVPDKIRNHTLGLKVELDESEEKKLD